MVNIKQNQQTIDVTLNITWGYCMACASILAESGQFSLVKWLDKQSTRNNLKFMIQTIATDENGVWFSFIGIGK